MCQIFWANDFITSPIHVNKSPTINIKESWNLAARIGMKISEAIILTILLRWSPYILDCFSWLLDCVIYLRLRKNDMFAGSEPKPGRFLVLIRTTKISWITKYFFNQFFKTFFNSPFT